MQGPGITVAVAGMRPRKVRPGAIIGRLASAEVRVLDARVSSAHALVALRTGGFQLLALRGRLQIDGVEEPTVDLEVGSRVQLAEGVDLEVMEVELPERVLALQVDDTVVQLWADVYSLVKSPTPELVPEYRAGALAYVCSSASGWLLERRDATTIPIVAGDEWALEGVRLFVTELPVSTLANPATLTATDLARSPLRVVGRFTTVQIHRRNRESVALNGQPAQLVTELGEMGVPAPWEVLAGSLWRDVPDLVQLRRRFDRVVQRIRQRLREHGIRENLVRSSGTGSLELWLEPGDGFELDA